jgi:predicted AAA+ superfamily ATPase
MVEEDVFRTAFYLIVTKLVLRWRLNFISTYLERDVPQFGSRIPSTSLRSLWTMLAHSQGGQLNTARLGANLGVTIPTAKSYIELLYPVCQ